MKEKTIMPVTEFSYDLNNDRAIAITILFEPVYPGNVNLNPWIKPECNIFESERKYDPICRKLDDGQDITAGLS